MLKAKKVLVAGDLMLDVYTIGEVKRISPEAPVPVLHVSEEKRLPGGAGNAILNLVSLGMEVVALGRVGEDTSGRHLLGQLAAEDVDTRGVLSDPAFQTPTKNRMLASGQQLMRVDYETPAPLSENLQASFALQLPLLLEGVSVVAISDYAKGFLTPGLLKTLIEAAKSQDIPIIVDPKGKDFTRYEGATLLKPNLMEAYQATTLTHEATLEEVAEQIFRMVNIENLMVTRSQHGIALFKPSSARQDFPARVHEVKDVTGAGDTVLAVLTAAVANGYTLEEATQLANVAAGLAIERIGCARISREELASQPTLLT